MVARLGGSKTTAGIDFTCAFIVIFSETLNSTVVYFVRSQIRMTILRSCMEQ